MQASLSLEKNFSWPRDQEKLVMEFIRKIKENPAQPSLKIKPLANARDPRVRTARLNDKYRAVLMELDGTREKHFLLIKVDNHDEANTYAANLRVRANPTNGMVEVTSTPDRTAAELRRAQERAKAERRAEYYAELAEQQAGHSDAAQPRSGQRPKKDTAPVRAPMASDLTAGAQPGSGQRPKKDTAPVRAPMASDLTAGAQPGAGQRPKKDTAPVRAPMASGYYDATQPGAGQRPEKDASPVQAPMAKGRTDAAQPGSGVAPSVTTVPPAHRIFQESGITPEALSDELGLSPEAIEAIQIASDDDHLLTLLALTPSWEEDAVTGLASGMSIPEVMESLGLEKPAEPVDEDDSDALIDSIRKSSMWVEPSEMDLKNVLENGSFADWRTFLHPSQAKAATAQHRGSARISGGAGTGKTVVLLHRAKFLLDQSGGEARVLLTTFTRDLANQLKSQMNVLDPQYVEASVPGAPGLLITGIDAHISQFLRKCQPREIQAGLEAAFDISSTQVPTPLMDREAHVMWADAAELHGGPLPKEKQQPEFLADEFDEVILTHSITSLGDYLKVNRSGRRTPLGRSERKAVWAITRSFVHQCASQNKLTFSALAVLAACILEKRERPHLDHILVDEAQDFHAGHWRFIRASVERGPNDICLAEDSHQRIYRNRLTLSHYGIETRGRASTRLRLNYRTTAQTLAFASAILEDGVWVDSSGEDDDLTGYRSVRRGPEPEVLKVATPKDEVDIICDRVRQWLGEESPSTHIGILARNRNRVKELIHALSEQGIEVQTQRAGVRAISDPVSVMTMHNAKGMEFSHVVLANVTKDSIPQTFRLGDYAEAERAEALLRERALLYVAASRARDALVVTACGELSPLLPEQVRKG